mgnify:CR=1 FL=1
MNEQSIQKQYNQIVNLLEDKRLKEALVQLDAFLYNGNDWSLRNRLEQIQTSYQYMLQYMKLGMKDPERQKLYRQLLADTWEIADQTRIALLDEISTHYYHSLRRNPKQLPKAYGISTLQKILEGFADEMAVSQLANYQGLDAILRRHEETHQVMFLTTWSNSSWTLEEFAQAEDMLRSETLPTNDLCLFVSAVTLSLMECFDERKVNWLLDGLRHTNPQINQRALVGLVITLHLYPSRIALYPELEARISLFREDPNFSKQVNRIYIQLLRSQETEKIDRKMREEIIPEMMKNPKLNLEGLDEDAEDHNPEWEEWIDRSGITDKLRELGELQMSGADVYMSTFSQLKQFPFFRKISHWFYPFDPQYQDIAKLSLGNDEQKISLLNILMNSDVFCNSDKYSFCFTMLQMPESQRNLMQQQLNGQHEASEELKERLKEMSQSKARAEFVSRQYIHDLYRFFKLWSRRHEIHDIFEDTLDLWNKEALSQALLHKEYINKLADYLFTHDDLAEAGILYDKSIELYNRKNAELWQKAGFIYQKIGSYKKAIDYYLQSDLLIPDNTWNNRHLAQCYRKEGNYPKALEYYNKVEQAQPDSLNLALQIGQCLMALERYDEALAYFFKVEYLDKKPQNARRAIGWCSFITGNHQQAKKYYDLLISEPKPIMEDWMNAGHVYYILNETEKSIEYYRKAQELCDSHDEFVRLYQIDKKDLIKQGANEVDLFILPDELI